MQNKLLITGSLSALFLIVNSLFLKNVWLGSLFFVIYFVSLSLAIGQRIKLKKWLEQLVLGSILFISALIILNSLIYYIYGTTRETSLVMLVLPLVVFFWKTKTKTRFKIKKKIHITIFLPILVILADIGFLFFLYTRRTFDLMPSPWQAVGPLFFLAILITTILLFYSIKKAKNIPLKFLASSTHFFVFLSITSILYPLGFGFDAFIHRATETWIFENGFILPKQPYYVGQYSLVVWLRQITQIPIFYLDVYLVPVLSSLLLPGTIGLTLKRVWKIPFKKSLLFAWLIPFVPFLVGYLNLTTPFNLAFLFAIITIFSSLLYFKEKINFLFPALATLAVILTHALLGVPLAIFVFSSLLLKKLSGQKLWQRLTVTFAFLASASALPIIFSLRNMLLGYGWPNFVNPLNKINYFLDLFRRPFWYEETSPLTFELLYTWAWIIVPLVILIGLFGLIENKERKYLPKLFFWTALGLFASAWLLRSWVVFPDVASYEQGDFPMRLIKTSLLFLLPWAMLILRKIFKNNTTIKQHNNKTIQSLTITFVFSTILIFSLYLSYPQVNPKVQFPGFNVTQADFDAVEWIHAQNEELNYIVLSNQLVSAAALTNYSFAKYFQTQQGEIFYYSIPTGGPIYKQYQRMLYEGQEREFMKKAMEIAGVEKSYFVINDYWVDFAGMVEGAKKTADSWQIIGNGKIWIFEYSKSSN